MTIAVESPNTRSLMVPRRSWLGQQWYIWRHKQIGLAALIFVVFLVVLAALAPVMQTHDPLKNELREVLVGPSADHFFGTDPNGRDVYSRIVGGARVSIFVGFSAVIFGISAAVLIGVVSGFAGGLVDYTIQRVMDAVMAIPGLILLLAVVSVPEPTWGNMLSGANRRFMVDAPWLVIAPAAAISLTVLSFMMLGDALRDILDPRMRGTT